ncbi:MAG: DUF2007 domain-containing protein [Planctomycetota bacterium]
MPGKGKQMAPVYSGPAAEAGRVKELLDDKGIETVVRDQTVPTDSEAGIMGVDGIVAVRVLVPKQDLERARELIQGIAQ